MIIGKTDCGVQYAVRQTGSAAAYCSLSIRCGTRDEGGFHEGIAHFTEHAVFKGTARRSARVINGCLDRLGGELNAFTTKEEIVLHATVLAEDTAKAVSLLLDLATQPSFPEDEIEIERGVVTDEIHASKDSPADDIYDRFEEAFFEGHPLGRSILGTAASVRKITPKELHLFHDSGFLPSRMALSVVSGQDEAALEKKIRKIVEKTFASCPVRENGADRMLSVPELRHFDRRVEKRNHEVNAVFGGPAPALDGGPDRFAAILLANILGGPASNSLLNDLLRERNGWVYGVECNYTPYADAGLMAVSLGCERPNLERCLAAAQRVIARLQEKPLTERTLRAAKKQLLGQLAISGEGGETQSLSMGKSLLAFGTVYSDGENRKAIEAVTAEQVRETACRVFDPAKTSRLVFL